MKTLLRSLTTVTLGAGALSLLPAAALAHTGVGATTGLLAGMHHPLGGLDHLLAMIAVGLWAAQIGGRAIWVVPSAFVLVMILGGALGFGGIAVPFIEEGILLSVLVLGVLIAGAFKFPLAVSALIVGTFALFHGHAHGAEMPATAGALSYSLGFALVTASLHGLGIAVGIGLRRFAWDGIGRLAGGAIALTGVYLAVT